jgi:hypothetical protein
MLESMWRLGKRSSHNHELIFHSPVILSVSEGSQDLACIALCVVMRDTIIKTISNNWGKLPLKMSGK